MTQGAHDLVPPVTLQHAQYGGPQRSRRPVYVDLLPPCNHACPAGENIQAWLALAQQARYEDAWRSLVENNPMPAVHGRVCYHPCEDRCNRSEIDQTVSIHAVERFLGDRALVEGWRFRVDAPRSGARVLVVGAGPSGLSAAYQLARLGHEVEIRDAGPVAGGMMYFGIPAYRLPRSVLEAEVRRIEAMGVRITLDHKVEDVLAERRGFDAVFVAVGAHLSKRTDIPARDAGAVLDAVAFLRDVERGSVPRIGRRVAVYGGGNTAMDAARSALRLGFEPLIVYRRDRDHMPAHAFEADEALEEGVAIHWLRTIRDIDGPEMRVEVMRLDADGRPQPTGVFETLEADALVLALGQDTDSAFLRAVPGVVFDADGTVQVDSQMRTGHDGIFAGGDMVPSERTVTIAVGHGKKAARNIDAYLRGTAWTKPEAHRLADFRQLHVWLSTEARRSEQPHIALEERRSGFEEVIGGLTESQALFEAKRCLSCGNCFECDGCLGACPENAIVKLGAGARYRFNYDLCAGCAVCFEQCPCHAIDLVAESGHGR